MRDEEAISWSAWRKGFKSRGCGWPEYQHKGKMPMHVKMSRFNLKARVIAHAVFSACDG